MKKNMIKLYYKKEILFVGSLILIVIIFALNFITMTNLQSSTLPSVETLESRTIPEKKPLLSSTQIQQPASTSGFSQVQALKVSSDSAVETITNGGFESGDFTGWTTGTGSEQASVSTNQAWIVHSGVYGGHLCSWSNGYHNAWIEQEFSTETVVYTTSGLLLTFWARFASGRINVTVTYSDGTTTVDSFFRANTWENFETYNKFTVTGLAVGKRITKVRFDRLYPGNYGGLVTGIDDISLLYIPPTEAIINGGFESGDFTGWTTGTGSEQASVSTNQYWIVHSGVYGGHLCSWSNGYHNAWIEQEFSPETAIYTTSGAILTFWARFASGRINVTVTYSDGTTTVDSFFRANTWENFETYNKFTVTGLAVGKRITKVRFDRLYPGNYGGLVTGIDDISLLYMVGIDNSAPTITLNSPGDGSEVQAFTIIDLSVTDDNTIDQVLYNWDDASNQSLVVGGSYDVGTSLLGEGMHTLNVNAVDNAGNWRSASYTFIIDNTAPMIILEDPEDGSEIQIGNVIDLSVTDDNTIDQVLYNWDDVNNQSLVVVGSYDVGTSLLGEGTHTLNVYTVDNAGNWRSASYTFITDNTAPMIILEDPEDGSEIQIGKVIDLSISDDNTIDQVLYNWDDVNNQSLVVGGSYDVGTSLLGEGTHTLNVYTVDNAGNWQSASYTFITDNTAPMIILEDPEDGSEIQIGNIIDLSISDDNTIDQVLYNWDDASNQSLVVG